MPAGPETDTRIERLRSDDVETRRRAARECYQDAGDAGLGWPTVRALAALTSSQDYQTRTYAQGALTAERSEWADESDRVPDLLRRLGDGGDDRRRAVLVEHLARATGTTVFVDGPALGEALAHDDPAVRRSLTSAVFACSRDGRGDVREHLDALGPSLSDPDPAVRANVTAAVALAAAGDEAALAAVVERLADPNPLVRRAAVRPLSGEQFHDVDGSTAERLLSTYVERAAACTVDPDPEVRREADRLLTVGHVREHDDWRTAVLPVLVEGVRKGRGENCRGLLEDLAAADPAAIVPHLDGLFDGAGPAGRVTAARVATPLLGTGDYPVERAVAALSTAVREGTTPRQALATLREIAEHHPHRVRKELPTLYEAVAVGDRRARSAAMAVIAALAEADSEGVPAAARALAEEESLAAIADDHPGFVAARVRELIDRLAQDPDRRDEFGWRWITDVVEADATVLDAAAGTLAEMLAAGGERRAAAAEILLSCHEDADLTPLVGPLRKTLTDEPDAVPRGVLRAFESVAVDHPALAGPVVDDITAWLTHYEGRAAAASILEVVAEATDETLPPVARTLFEEGGWTRGEGPDDDEDPLAVLAAVDPPLVEDGLRTLVDRYCEEEAGDVVGVLDAISAVHDAAPEPARTAVRRLDARLTHYGRRLDVAETFFMRVENGQDDLAGAGLGLLGTALEYDRVEFREQVAAAIRRAVETELSAAADAVGVLAEYVDDGNGTVRDVVHDALVTAAETDPAKLRDRAISAGEALTDHPGADERADPLLAVVELLHDADPELAAAVVFPLALDALLEVTGGFEALDPADLLVPLAEVAALDPDGTGAEPLAGLTVVFTGSVDGYTRQEAREAVERAEGRATTSVSARTDLLVVGAEPGESKRRAAVQNAVPMVRAESIRRVLDATSE